MATTLLQLCQNVADEVGLARPTAVFSSSDRLIQRMLKFTSREARDLVRMVDWTILQKLYTFTTTASTAEYALPTDYHRLIHDTEWDRSGYRPIYGPLSPTEWQTLKSGLLGSGTVGRRYRIYRSDTTNTRTFRLDPTPDTSNDGETLAFEYISKNWCATSGGVAASAWAADTDVTLLDQDNEADLHILGTIVRMKRSLGLDFASEADEYNAMLATTRGQDRPAPTLSLVPRPAVQLIGLRNLPDGNYG